MGLPYGQSLTFTFLIFSALSVAPALRPAAVAMHVLPVRILLHHVLCMRSCC